MSKLYGTYWCNMMDAISISCCLTQLSICTQTVGQLSCYIEYGTSPTLIDPFRDCTMHIPFSPSSHAVTPQHYVDRSLPEKLTFDLMSDSI